MQSIRWGERLTHLTHTVSELYGNSELTDCILDVEGESIHVHKIIIAACSPYFKKLLKKDHTIKLLSIKDVSYKDMKFILDFIYYGVADVYITDMTSLLKTAELLEMISLKHNICDGFQKKFSCKNTSERTIDERSSVPCTNLIRHETKHLMEEQVPYKPVLFMSDDVHAIGGSSANYLNNFQDASGKSNKHQSKSSVPNTCDSFEKNAKKDEENVNEGLVPFTFVAVSEIKEANERLQDNLTCFDSVLKDPLGEYSGMINVTEEISVKKEFTFQSEIQVKKESKDDNDVPESMSEGVLISDKLTPSFHELTSTNSNPTESCDQESGMDRNPDAILSDTFGSEGFAPQKTLDLEIIYESICEISGADVKEEKVFETGLGLNHIVGDNAGTAPLEPQSELLNSCVQHLSITDCQQDGNEASTSEIINHFSLEKENKTEAMYEARAFFSGQTIFGEDSEKKTIESGSSSYDDESLISKKQINLPPLVQRDPLPLPLRPQFGVRNDQVGNVLPTLMHMQTHSSAMRSECPISYETFGNESFLGTYSSCRPLECVICKKSFARKESLTQHIRTHTGDRPFECQICKRSFSQRAHLNVHMPIHTGDRPFECEICGKTFAQKVNLTIHIRNHTGNRPFECEICKKSFARKECLNQHKRTHTGDRPFECQICKKAFSQRGHLNVHMQTHTGERPFTCEICGKTFALKYNLTHHIRIHTGDRPYECTICKKSFTMKGNLKKHMEVHIGDRRLGCEISSKLLSHEG